MGEFVRTNWSYAQVKLTQSINGLVYFARKIPIIGKKIPATLFRVYDLKLVLLVFALFIELFIKGLFKFLWCLIYYAFAVGITMIMGESLNIEPSTMRLTLLLLITGSIFMMNSTKAFFTPLSSDIYDYVRQFHLSYLKILKPLNFFEEVEEVIAYFVPVFIIGIMAKLALRAFLFVVVWRFISFASAQLINRRTVRKNWSKPLIYFLSYGGYVVVAAIVYGIWKFQLMNAFFSYPMLLVLIGLMILLFRLVNNYKFESQYVSNLVAGMNDESSTLNWKEQMKKNNSQNYLKDGINMKKKLKLNTEKDFSSLKGSKMLNTLLFYRYEPILRKSVLLRLVIFAGILVTFIGLKIIVPSTRFSENEAINVLPVLFMVMYFITFGRKIVQMCFVNCDIAMLYYPFYRESSTILSGFNERFKKTFQLNGLCVLGIFMDILVAGLLFGNQWTWKFYLMSVFLLLALNCLFSFHELFVYYLLQPFTANMDVVNPVYKWISGVLYFICYMNLRVRSTSYWYLIIISLVIVVYVSIGLIVIKKKAPQTFRIKN
ncbi:MAG: hypothetical protein LBM95_05280 [Lactobacillales bacterium]|jgi:hypothetical protein|nr:hypothetical protein [Lactobacillales bacterium]